MEGIVTINYKLLVLYYSRYEDRLVLSCMYLRSPPMMMMMTMAAVAAA